MPRVLGLTGILLLVLGRACKGEDVVLAVNDTKEEAMRIMCNIGLASLAAATITSATTLMIDAQRAVLGAAEMASLVGAEGSAELFCGLLGGFSLGMSISALFGCGPCAVVGVVGAATHLIAC